MNWRKFISSVCAVTLVAAAVSGCGSESKIKKNSFDSKTESSFVEDTFIAENDNYTMSLNELTMGVTLTDKKTGKVYGTNPSDDGEVQYDELGMPIKRHPQIESALFLEYLDIEANTTSKLISYTAAVNGGRTVLEKKENGIKVSYYFDDAKIMVPITYTLREDGVSVTLNPKEIQEGKNMLISVSVAPYWCSVKNTDKNGYLLYPSGSGALVYAKEISQPGEAYSDEVYGTDASKEVWDKVTTEKAIRMPVFGAKTSKQAVFAIIEQGAESSLLDMTVGSTSIGYSSVYVTYQLRGFTSNIKELYNNRFYKGEVYADNMVEAPLTVGFYPISDKSAGYSEMAAVYKEYLNKTEGTPKNVTPSQLDLTMVGGAMIQKSFLGIPYKTLYPTTTLSQASDILKDLKSKGVTVTNLNLYGFGENGINSNKLAGNFRIDGKLGNKKDIKSLKEANKNTNLFFDFDTVCFSDSANGFSSYFDAAVRANRKPAKYYSFDIAVLGRKTTDSYSILARDSIADAVNSVVKKSDDWAIDGIGLSRLSNIAYSDYTDKQNTAYYAKAGISKQVSDILGKITDKKVLGNDANMYAAIKSDLIINAPTFSTKSRLFDVDIPFYSMVLRGRAALSGESVNLSEDADLQRLRAVESGVGLAYTLTADYSTKLLDCNSSVFYNSLYSDIKDSIIENYNSLSDYYGKIANSDIISHKIHENGIRETVFSNGVKVYVNYSEKEIKIKSGSIPAKSFLVEEAGV